MNIGTVNDNSKKLKMWGEILPEAALFSHPSLVFLKKETDLNTTFDVLILDRIYHECDILEDDTISKFREAFPGVIIILSSALHVENESVPGIDITIDQWPIDLKTLKVLLETLD